jgi:hypothetical protein
MYRFEKNGATIEIEGNRGTISLTAPGPREALKRAERLFTHMRDVAVAGTAERYTVSFRIDHKYRKSLLKKMQRLAAVELTRENYEELEPLEKYMVLLHAQLTGKETFLGDSGLLRGALLAVKNELVRQGEVADPDAFMDYDIVVYNAAET